MEMLTYRQMNKWNNTNFESHLAMMVIYLPVKFKFGWTKHFGVRVSKRKMLTDRQTDKKWTNKQMELHQF